MITIYREKQPYIGWELDALTLSTGNKEIKLKKGHHITLETKNYTVDVTMRLGLATLLKEKLSIDNKGDSYSISLSAYLRYHEIVVTVLLISFIIGISVGEHMALWDYVVAISIFIVLFSIHIWYLVKGNHITIKKSLW